MHSKHIHIHNTSVIEEITFDQNILYAIFLRFYAFKDVKNMNS